MEKNKYDFISELLETKKLSPSQKERILKLSAQELKGDFSDGKEIKKRLKVIEEELGTKKRSFVNHEHIVDKTSTGNISKLPRYIDYNWLSHFFFNLNDNPILKTTCHEIDSDDIKMINKKCDTNEYCFDKHLGLILKEFRILDKINAPFYAKALVRGYFTGLDYKGKLVEKWSVNWSCSNLMAWASSNPGLPPNLMQKKFREKRNKGFVLDGFTSEIDEKRIQTFTELVIHFKYMFHIRSDNSLKEILIRINQNMKWEEKIDFEIENKDFPKNIEIFTYVERLLEVYKKLIKLIIEKKTDSKAKVKLSFYQKGGKAYLAIFHINSIYGKSLEDTRSNRLYGKEYRNIIQYGVNGLCNLYLEAKFGPETYARINLWDGAPPKDIEIDKINGVKHILEFSKPKHG